MHTIKKYANRKLYHTNQKQYITLEGIAHLIQDGEVVQVLDNETGEDITPSILAQVVLQTRGRDGPQLPTTLLTGFIQLGGGTLASLRKAIFSSLGAGELVGTEIDRRINTLISRGDLSSDEADRWRKLLLSNDFAQSTDNQIAARESDLPSQNDIARLHAQVDALSTAVEQLLSQQGRK